MPPTISSISAFKQNITGAGAWDALAAVSGDSLAVADFADGSRAYVEELITGASNATTEFSVFSTRFGDPIYGLRVQHMFNPTLSNDNRWVTDASYAVLGLTTSVPLQCVRLYGPDTGYAKIPCPGHWNAKLSAGWFVRQARLRGVPHIPIINSNNAGLTFLDAIHTAAAASTKISLNVVQLRNKFVG
jgi:hypothetical protein